MAVIVRDSIPVAEVGNERQKSKGESGGKNWWRENFWGGGGNYLSSRER